MKHVNVVQAGGGRGLSVNWSSKATWRLPALPHLLNESRPGEMEMSPELRVHPRQVGMSSSRAEQSESTQV